MPAVKRRAPAFFFSKTNSKNDIDSKDVTYKVSLTKTVRIISTVCSIAVGTAIFTCLYFPKPADKTLNEWLYAGFLIALAVGATYYALLMWPRRITVYADRLVLKKGIGKKTLLFSDIESIERRDDLAFDMRLIGSGGMLGYTGWFTNSDFGRYMSYVGDYKDTFLIVTRKRKYVMSCDRPDELVEEVKRRIEAQNKA